MPQNPAAPKDPVAAAAAALAGARQKFPASMAKAAGVVGRAPARMTSAPTPVKKESLPAGAGADVPAGIKWNQDQAGAVKDIMPKTPIVKYHKGGKIKHDGVQVIDAQRGETVLPNNEKGSKKHFKEHMKMMAADKSKSDMEGLGKAAESMKKKVMKSAKDLKKKVEPMKKGHDWKRTVVTHHPDGSHTMAQEHDSDATMDQSSAHPDTASMMDKLQGSLGPQSLADASGGGAPEAPAAPPAAA